MKQSFRFKLISFALIAAYLLSACGGTLPQSTTSDGAPKVQASEIVFTGIVEQINGNQWVVSGQAFTVDAAAALDSGIAVGDIVKVEGTVSEDGSVVALKIESSSVSDENANEVNSNSNNNSNDDNSNDVNSNGADDNSNEAGDDDEVIGNVEALTADSITVDGITYHLADFTEFKDAIAVGDQVKIHVIVNADGTFTIREIERSDGLSGDNDNSNDDNTNAGNSNDDNSNDDSGGHGGGDDDNSNDDNGNDD